MELDELKDGFYKPSKMTREEEIQKLIDEDTGVDNYGSLSNGGMIMKLWIARDRDGLIYLYMKKPIIITHYFDTKYLIGEIDETLFPEVTFENSPQEVELKLVK